VCQWDGEAANDNVMSSPSTGSGWNPGVDTGAACTLLGIGRNTG
jgi:hypothetical protein